MRFGFHAVFLAFCAFLNNAARCFLLQIVPVNTLLALRLVLTAILLRLPR